MVQIGICDDEKEIQNNLSELISRFCLGHHLKAMIHRFASGEELLKHATELELLFLDIDMPKMDGIETGARFRRQNEKCKIVMETGVSQRMREAFHLEAFRFLVKPFSDEEVNEALSAFLSSQVGMKMMQLYENRSVVYIPQRDIDYIQAYDSYSELFSKGRRMRSEKSLQMLMQELDERLFFQINRKYIVNFRSIEQYHDGMVVMKEQTFPVSRRRKKEFKHLYSIFDLTYR